MSPQTTNHSSLAYADHIFPHLHDPGLNATRLQRLFRRLLSTPDCQPGF